MLFCFVGIVIWLAWLQQQLPPLLYGFNPSTTTFGSRPARFGPNLVPTVFWDPWQDVNEYLTDAATKVSYHKPIHIKNQVSSTRLTTEADYNFVYISLLVKVGFDLFGKSITLGAKEPPSFLHQQRGIVAIGGGATNNGIVI